MRQARTVLSTYSADTFGVCSALYELGGMTVMHDASGCNSTYSTHDEPRWYDSDSLVFISGLTETDAVMGNDEKLIEDILTAAKTFHPAFIALAGTPIPMMTGFDYTAVAKAVERRSGIPAFGFATNGMQSYLCGASDALAAYASRFTKECHRRQKNTVNILGATPLDFSVCGTVERIRALLAENGKTVKACFAMGSTPEELSEAGKAAVNLVIAGSGMKTARFLKEKYGTPYVVGTPAGQEFSKIIWQALDAAQTDGADRVAFDEAHGFPVVPDGSIAVIGEPVISRSIAAAVYLRTGRLPRVIDPLETPQELNGILLPGDIRAQGEEDIAAACRDADTVLADGLYKPVLPRVCRLIEIPHEAFSGRIYRNRAVELTALDIGLS